MKNNGNQRNKVIKNKTTPKTSIPRPPTRAQIRRMGIIYNEIASGKFPNRRSLAQLLRVSESTVKRDMLIMEMDYPIEYHQTKFGYYFDGPVTASKGLPVSRREMIAALFLMQGMEHLQGTCWEAALESLCEKIAEGFPDIVTFHPSDWQKVMSNRTNGKTIVPPEKLEQLVTAIAKGETVRVRNYNQKGEYSERDLDPYHIQRFEDNLYLIAKDHKHGKELTFGAWRLEWIKPTGRTFVKPPGFDPNKFFDGSLGIYAEPNAEPRNVVIGFRKQVSVMILERQWNGQTGIEKLPDGSVELQMRLKGLIEVSRLILRWGPDVVRIEPPDLMQIYKGYLDQMNANYAQMCHKAERKELANDTIAHIPIATGAGTDQANGLRKSA